jgi:acyl carrier protein
MKVNVRDFEAFVAEIADFFGFGPGGVRGTTRFWDDLDFDSLDVFELVMLVEALAGLDVPREETPILATVEDAYQYYRRCVLTHDRS